MIEEPFATGDSILHRLDARFKIVAATAFSVLVAVSYQLPALALAVTVSIIAIACARLNMLKVARRLGVLLVFIVLIWMLLPFTYEGPPMASLGPLTAYQNGVMLAGQITLKSVAILLVLMALIATSDFVTLGHALNRMRVSGKLVFLLLMTYRYVYVIYQEYDRLMRAAKVRGFKPRTDLHTYRTFAYITGMLFVRAANRAERVVQAMRCRGFNGRFYSLAEFGRHPSNWIFLAITAFILCSLAAAEWML